MNKHPRNTSELIESLVSDLKPVRSQWKPLKFGIALSIAVLLGASWSCLYNPWVAHPTHLLKSVHFVASDLGWIALLFASAVFIGKLRGASVQAFERSTALVLVTLAALLLSNSDTWHSGGLEVETGFDCTKEILMFAVLGAVLSAVMLKRGAVVRPVLAGVLTPLPAICAGALFLSIQCPDQRALHLFVWHLLLPMVISSTLCVLFSRRLYKI